MRNGSQDELLPKVETVSNEEKGSISDAGEEETGEDSIEVVVSVPRKDELFHCPIW
jgi:hypothetical protein